MPSQPPDPYVRQFDFTNHEQTQPTKPLPGSKVDLELNEVRESLNSTISRLNEIQADDGKIRDAAISATLAQKVAAAEAARNDAVDAKIEAVAAKDATLAATSSIIGTTNTAVQQAQQAAEYAVAQRGLAQQSANNAASSAVQAVTQAGISTASATTATTQANLALTRANAATTSANAAAVSADAAAQSALDAEASAQAAEDAAASINATTYAAPLEKTGNQVSIDPAYKPNPFDQTLNTTDNPTFNTVFGTVGFYLPTSGGDTRLAPTNLSFGEPADIDGVANLIFTDATTQTTAGLSPADAASTYYPLTNPAGYIGRVVEVTDNTNAALRITQLGTGEAFRVEDAANPDATPFVVTADGRVGINSLTSPSYFLQVGGNAIVNGLHAIQSSTSSGGLSVKTTAAAAPNAIFENSASSTADCVRITNLGSGNSFVVEDSANPDNSPFVIDSQGRVAVGSNVVSNTNFTVVGTSQFSTSSGTPVSILVSNTAASVTGLGVDYRGTGDSFRITNNTTERFVVDTNGNTEIAGSLKIGTSQALTGVATDAEAIAGSSNTVAVTPRQLMSAMLSTQFQSLTPTNMSAGSSGTGASTSSGVGNSNANLIAPNAGVLGYATRGGNFTWQSNSISSAANFSRPSGAGVKIWSNAWTSGNTDVHLRLIVGRISGGIPPTSPITYRAYGWQWNFGTSTLSILAHNGTTLTTKNVTFSPVGFRAYEIAVMSDGAGTISLFIDGVFVDSTTGGPTGSVNQGICWYQTEIENLSASSPANTQVTMHNPKAFWLNG